MSKILCTGAGGFIGGHLVKRLLDEGHKVRAVDIKPRKDWWQDDERAEAWYLKDLSNIEWCRDVTEGIDIVYNLAASMGGMNFIENNKKECMLNVLINTHLLMASVENKVDRFFFSGSACMYNTSHQDTADVIALKESDAYPAMPEDGYGWEKLFSERMCEHFNDETDMKVRTARFHNVYGPYTSFDDIRGKAPATLSRKIAESIRAGVNTIEVWGDGNQTRSFMYIDDCLEGVLRITALEDDEYKGPMNLGTSEIVSINQLVHMIENIAGRELKHIHNLNAPQGVRGRNSDNTMIKSVLGWEPNTPLTYGLEQTYKWVNSQTAP